MLCDSAKELKSVVSLAVSSMLTALNVALGFLTFYPVPTLKASFAFIPLSVAGMLYGPVFGGIVGIAGDIIKFLVTPQSGSFNAYFPGFTISAFLTGVIYGCFLYKQKVTLWRVALAHLTVALFVHVLLNTFWLIVMGATTKSFWALISTRAVKNAVLYPFETAIIYGISKALDHILQRGRVKVH